jgi:glycerophosphoryl diester phosphodiesterase
MFWVNAARLVKQMLGFLDSVRVERNMRKPLIVAHRGDNQFAPENSMAAFDSAISKSADAIEFDVHLTRDQQLVVHHDHYLGRTEMGSGSVGDYSLEELQAFDIGSWFGDQFKGERMPSLSDVLSMGKGKVRFEIELRCPAVSFWEKVMNEIDQFGVANDVEITSPHIPLLHHIKKNNSDLRKGVFFNIYPEWKDAVLGQQHVLEWMILIDAQVVHLPYSLLESEFVERMHEHNFMVHGSNLGSSTDIKLAIEKGIDQLSTDKLGLAVEVRDTIVSSET